MNTPELLMPAGSLQKLKYALAYGADAVYAGIPYFSLRARENEFSVEALREGIDYAHSIDKKVYVTANIFARNLKIKPFSEQLPELMELGADAWIMSDPGLISMVKEKYPDAEIHLSVQANCMNWQSVKFWRDQGVSRVILSRELRLTEIQKIKEMVPDIELEAFVHGSICIAYSGRCLLSHYMSHRDANQGVCDNSCRYSMKLFSEPKEKRVEENNFYLEDERNPGELYPIDEDENGTYIMNAKDLRLVQHLKEIIDAGVVSLKVEGRTKSVFYSAMVARTYRDAIDDAVAGKAFDQRHIQELDKIANRGYHTGFLVKDTGEESQSYSDSSNRSQTSVFVGMVTDTHEKAEQLDGKMFMEVRNRLERGQKVEVVSPAGVREFTVGTMVSPKGEEVGVAHGGTGVFAFDVPFKPDPFSVVRITKD